MIFYKLKEVTRDSLIKAGTEEFSIHGRQRSSLNQILKNAEVSKGVFYHHFNDKEHFFEQLIRYSADIIVKYLNHNSLLERKDYIDRLIQAMLLKYDLFQKYEFFLKFLIRIYEEYPLNEVQDLLTNSNPTFSQRVLMENIDTTLFNTEMDVESYKKIIGRYINQLSTEISLSFKSLTKQQVKEFYVNETKELRMLTYKEEYYDTH